MSDLIERLRQGVEHYDDRDDAVMKQAADEIERLRRELAELPIALELVKTWRQQAERLERELAEARELLKEVRERWLQNPMGTRINAFLAGEKK